MTKQYYRPRLRKESKNPITMKKAIARDVLIRLSEGSLDAQSVYLEGFPRYQEAKNAVELRSMFIDDPECTACAIGAAFTSGIRLYNKVSPRNVDSVVRGAASRVAQKWFTHDELSVMEMYFENSSTRRNVKGLRVTGLFHDDDSRWFRFNGMDKKVRMRAIFETIAKTGTVDETAIVERLTQCSEE